RPVTAVAQPGLIPGVIAVEPPEGVHPVEFDDVVVVPLDVSRRRDVTRAMIAARRVMHGDVAPLAEDRQEWGALLRDLIVPHEDALVDVRQVHAIPGTIRRIATEQENTC